MARRVSHSARYGVWPSSMGAKNSAGVRSKYAMISKSPRRDGSAAPLVMLRM